VLLESFNPDSWGLREVYSRRADSMALPNTKSPGGVLSDKPLTGYSPLSNLTENESMSAMNSHKATTLKDGDCNGYESESAALVKHADAMHLACKALLLVVRHRGTHVRVSE
jgi:hypothetical protein